MVWLTCCYFVFLNFLMRVKNSTPLKQRPHGGKIAASNGLNPEEALRGRHKRHIKGGGRNTLWNGVCLAALTGGGPAPGDFAPAGWHRKPRIWHVYKDGYGNKAAPRRSLYLLRRGYSWRD